ncbi:MAG: hypothetical protein ACE3L7_31015 [Candidatus Pristimantibacillus sp.]
MKSVDQGLLFKPRPSQRGSSRLKGFYVRLNIPCLASCSGEQLKQPLPG